MYFLIMLFNLLIFMIVLLIYLHIYFHLKVNNDLDIYEHNTHHKNELDEVLNLRQPVVINSQYLENTISLKHLYSHYKDTELYIRKNNIPNDLVDKYISVKVELIKDLFENDNKYYSDKNYDFLDKNNLLNNLSSIDKFIQPNMVSEKKYDFVLGGKNTTTKFQVDPSFRNFFYVADGELEVILSPPENNNKMNMYKDYYNFEFISSINPFLAENKEKVKNFSKIELKLVKGQLLFIPAYWFYSFKFNETILIHFNYKTYMNQLSILPDYLIHFMQRMNVKKKREDKLFTSDIQISKDKIKLSKDKNQLEKKTKKDKKRKKINSKHENEL